MWSCWQANIKWTWAKTQLPWCREQLLITDLMVQKGTNHTFRLRLTYACYACSWPQTNVTMWLYVMNSYAWQDGAFDTFTTFILSRKICFSVSLRLKSLCIEHLSICGVFAAQKSKIKMSPLVLESSNGHFTLHYTTLFWLFIDEKSLKHRLINRGKKALSALYPECLFASENGLFILFR